MTPQYLTPRDGVVTLGDGQLYGGYLNYGPLNSEAGYQVAVAVTQSLGGESRVAVSDLVHIYTIYLHYLQQRDSQESDLSDDLEDTEEILSVDVDTKTFSQVAADTE